MPGPRRRVLRHPVPDHPDLVHVPDDRARGVLQDLRQAVGHHPGSRHQLRGHRSLGNDLSSESIFELRPMPGFFSLLYRAIFVPVGRAVATDIKDPWFKPNHSKII